MLRVGSIVIRVRDLAAQAAFWSAALDYVPRDRSEAGEPRTADEAGAVAALDFLVLRPRTGAGPNLSLDAHRSERSLPPRIHLDLYADDQAAEVDRLLALGARRVHWSGRPADADYVILEDPEGNRFCVIDTAR